MSPRTSQLSVGDCGQDKKEVRKELEPESSGKPDTSLSWPITLTLQTGHLRATQEPFHTLYSQTHPEPTLPINTHSQDTPEPQDQNRLISHCWAILALLVLVIYLKTIGLFAL